MRRSSVDVSPAFGEAVREMTDAPDPPNRVQSDRKRETYPREEENS